MKLLLDEHLSARVARSLRARSYDVVCVLETDLVTKPDLPIWEWAMSEDRVIVTFDVSDFPTLFTELFQEGMHHPGLVVVSSKTMGSHDIGGLIRALERLIESEIDLRDRCIFLQKVESP